MKNSILSRFAATLCVFACFLVSASATTFTVSNTLDTGAGSLRQAITDALGAAGPHDIQAGGVTGTISLQTALPVITNKTITIHGPTSGTLTVTRGSGTFRIFTVNNTGGAASLTVNRMSITNGDGGATGGCIYVTDASLNLNFCTVSGGVSSAFGGGISIDGGVASTVNINFCTISGNTGGNGQGGGVYSNPSAGASTLNITNSTISGNTSTLSAGGGLFVNRTVGTLVNCTISGNRANFNGGGIAVGSTAATLNAINCTITNNSTDAGSTGGGGIRSSGTGSFVNLINTLVVGNVLTGTGPDDTNWGTASTRTAKNSVVGAHVGTAYDTTTGSQIGTSGSPKVVNLGALANNGGVTQTHALLASAPELAIDLGSNSDVTTLPSDQRGTGYDRVMGGTVDIGAFETGATAPTFTGVSPLGAPAFSHGAGVLTLNNFTVPPGNDRVLVVVASDTHSLDVTSVSFGGTPMTQSVERNDTFAVDSIWVLPLGTATTATTGNITIARAAPGDFTFIAAQAFQNVHQTTPVSATDSAEPLSNAVSVTRLITSATGDLVLDVLDSFRTASLPTLAPTVSNGQAVVHSAGSAIGSGFDSYKTSIKPGAASVNMSWTTSSEDTLYLAVNLKQAAVAGPPPPTVTLTSTSINATATTVTITGTNFDSVTPGNNTVAFSPAGTGTVTGATTTSLTVTGVSGLRGGPLSAVVTNGGGNSGAAVQVANVAPVITLNTANIASSATQLTINGFGFDASNFTNNSVTFTPAGTTGSVAGSLIGSLNVNPISGLTPGALFAVATVNGVASSSVQVATVIAPAEIAVSYNGNNVADNSTTFATLNGTDFGNVPVQGVTVDHTFTITNTGGTALTLGSVTAGGDFTVTQPTSPVAINGGTTTFIVSFNPSATGTRTATITFTNSDSDENPFNFDVQGVGTGPQTFDLAGNAVSNTPFEGGQTYIYSAVVAVVPVPVSSPAGDVVTGGGAPDASGADSGADFDVLKRGGYLAENGHLVFPGQLLIGSGSPPVTLSPNTFMGLWKQNGTGLKLLARSGDPAPETGPTAPTSAKYDVLPQTPAINDSGEVTFLASLATNPSSTPPTTTDNDTGLWSELGGTGLGILIREGDVIPLLPAPPSPLQVGAFASGAFATAHTGATTGEAAFAITIKDGANLTDTAILRTSIAGAAVTAVGLVARENAAAPGVAGENFANLASSYTDSMRMDATGNLAFVALTKPSNKEGIWYQPVAGATAKVFVAGDTAPGTGSATFKNIKSPAIGSGGVITFRGLLNNDGDNAAGLKNDGIWRGTGSTAAGYTCILRRGDAAVPGLPVGSKVGNLWHSWLTNANHGAWKGWLDVDGNGTSAAPTDVYALYSDLSGTMNFVLKVGDAAPGIAGATFNGFDLPVVGGVEQMAFIGNVTGGGTTSANNSGVWRSAPNGGALTLVIRTGDTITTSQGARVIQKVDFPGSGSTDRRWEQPIMDATGRLIVFVTFTTASGGGTSQILVP